MQPLEDAKANQPNQLPLKWLLAGLALLVVLGAGLLLASLKAIQNPVPRQIRKSAPFAVYYPQQRRLPAGFTLDKTSFRTPENGVVVYAINANGQRLNFSEQQSPGSSVIDDFLKNYIPLHSAVDTKLGQAQTGVPYSKDGKVGSIISLTINHGPWLIITSPFELKPELAKQLIGSLAR